MALGMTMIFLGIIPKAQPMKEIIDKVDFIIIKNCLLKIM